MTENEHKPTARVLDTLELLAANPDGLSLNKIADSINVPKSTLSPIMRTLTDRGFTNQDSATSLFTLGISSFSIGASYISDMNALTFIQNQMKEVVKQTGEICQLGIRDHNMVLYIAKVDSKEAIRLVSYVGKRLPLYCTAIGKALLYYMDIEEIKKLYPEGLRSYTPNTITDFDRLSEELAQIQRTEIAKESREITDYIECIAVPLWKDCQLAAAMSVSIPSFRMTEAKEELIVSVLKQIRNNIETFLREQNVNISSFTLEG